MRAEFQVLVIPFVISNDDKLELAVFKRSDGGYWQFIAGGGENNETILEAAQREAYEEAGIARDSKYFMLDTTAMIPKSYFHDHESKKDLYVIPEYCFGVLIENKALLRSREHTEYLWVSYEEAMNRLSYDSNKTALWELRERIRDGDIMVH
jgi:dATP pyrophosphohydrolase